MVGTGGCAAITASDDDLPSERADDVKSGKALGAVDLAFLLPPPTKSLSNPAMPAASYLSPAQFKTMFDAVNGFRDARVTNEDDETKTAARLYVTGVRLDPCAPQAFSHSGSSGRKALASACHAELRLVVQPWLAPRQGDGFEDTAIHLVYRLDAATFLSVLKDFTAMRDRCAKRLKTATSTFPVGPHPCLANAPEADAAGFATDLALLLKKYASGGTLSGAALMVGANDGAVNTWEFRLFVNAGGKLQKVPALPFHPAAQGSDRSVISIDEDGNAYPAPTSSVATSGTQLPASSIQKLTRALRDERQASVLSGDAFSSDELKQALVAAYAATNPRLNRLPELLDANPSIGLDCTSCHVQGSLVTIPEERGTIKKLAAVNPSLYAAVKDAAYQGNVNGSNHLSASRNFYVMMVDGAHSTEQFVINFGYFGRQPSVNPRTVNEAIDAAGFLSR